MIILGINDSHNASASLLVDGKLVFAMEEERFNRQKLTSGFPKYSIDYIIKKYSLNHKNIDHVAVATKKLTGINLLNFAAELDVSGWLKFQEEYFIPKIYKNKKLYLRKVFKNYKTSVKMFYPVDGVPLSGSDEMQEKDYNNIKKIRLNFIHNYLQIDKKKIKFYDHHLCHAMYGYFTNPEIFKKKTIAIITCDAGGDETYNTINIVKNGVFKKIPNNSKSLLGQIYDSMTLLLGMNPAKHQYKIMGLAPFASEFHKKGPRKIFMDSLKVKNLNFIRSKNMTDYFFYFKEKLKMFRFDGIAGGLQDFLEIRLVEWFKQISKKTKINDFIFSGGVANNVKANKILTDQNFIKSLFVPAGPGDETLSIGAAYAANIEFVGFKKTKLLSKFNPNAYLGNDISKKDFKQFKNSFYIKKNYKFFKDVKFKLAAKALSKGSILLICMGRIEIGQRALGHRSIVCDPSNIDLVKKINNLFKKRDFWMPFAPSILTEDFEKYVINPKKIQSDYMTMSFNSTTLGQKHFKAAIHPYDHTLRPQKVSKSTCPRYYSLLKEFKKITGIGGLLNTSLNIHDKPIINQPTDILKEFFKNSKDSKLYKNIDNIYIEDTLFKAKN